MSQISGGDWTEKFLNLDFGDKRLNKRFFRIMDALSAALDKSIWTASGDRVGAKAAYRFFSNEAVRYDDLLRNVAGATVAKLRQIQPRRVLLVQDTTAISFGLRKDILGMGYYCDSEQRGMLLHSCLALTGCGVPVGLLYQEAHTELPAGMERLTVCDREGDFYELFADAEGLGEKFLVRLAQNRMTTEGKRPARRGEAGLPETLRLAAIYVHEAGTHEGLRWFLLTNSEVATEADAKERIGDYAQRWKIERFHYVLKSGCKIEEKQSRSFDGLAALTLLYSVIALQMMSLLYLRRLDGDLPASLFFGRGGEQGVVLRGAEEANVSESVHAPGRGVRPGEAGRLARRTQRRRPPA